ncbi:MAG TPA: outer membrane beta-barrel protein [Chitinophagaceae bacterium]|nr:outer membrane beta-barrel protein [Chitinophagaceae bacterium]
MQENNFEKAVRQKLDDLHLAPTEPVWQHIEATLKKKKDRRFLFWLLPVFLLGGVILWWHTTTKAPALQAVQPIATEIKEEETFSKPHIAQPLIKMESTAKPAAPIQATKAVENTSLNQSNRLATLVTKKAGKKSGEPVLPSPPASFSNSHARVVTEGVFNKKAYKNNAPINAATKTKQQQVIEGDSVQKADTALTVLQQLKQTQNDSLIAVTTPLITVSKRKQKLEWRLVARVGSSNIMQGLNSLFSGFSANKSLQDPASPQSYTSGYVYYSAAGAGNVTLQPAAPAKGLQFTLGGLLKKRVSHHSSLQTGLQYGFYSNHLIVGTNLPGGLSTGSGNGALSSRTIYQNNGARYRFTNTFHFIEMPVLFEYKVLKKRPLHMQQGIVVSQVIRSNVLQYDSFTNTYYKNESGLQKTMLQFVVGLDYTIYKSKTFSLQAGPQVQWSLQPVFKNKDAKSNLASGGLVLHMGF